MLDYHQLRQEKSSHETQDIEFRFVDRNQNIKHILTTITRIPETNRSVASLLDLTSRKQTEQERESLIDKLQKAVTEIKTLSGLLPICAFCKKVRDDQGYWKQVEAYVEEHSQVEFTHSICPDCGKKLYSTYQIEEE